MLCFQVFHDVVKSDARPADSGYSSPAKEVRAEAPDLTVYTDFDQIMLSFGQQTGYAIQPPLGFDTVI